MSCMFMTLLVLDLLAFANWRSAFSPDHAGSLAATFGPAHDRRSVILDLEARSPLVAAGAKVGDELSFDRASDAYRILGLGETVNVTLYAPAGSRALTLSPVQERVVAKAPVAYAAGFLAQGLCTLFALVLSLTIALRRPESGALRALSIGLLADSLDFAAFYLPGSAVQDALIHYMRPPLILFCVLAGLYFALSLPDSRPLMRLRGLRIAFWAFALVMAGLAAATIVDRTGGLTPALFIFLKQVRNVVLMGCFSLTLIALCAAWRRSEGIDRHRLAWIAACFGIANVYYFMTNYVALFNLMSERYLDIYGSLATTGAYAGLAYAVLRHRLFNFSFAVNRTLVFTVTSLLMFLAFWLIEQLVHRLVHFDAVENNAMLGGAIAFALFFAFNRLHHRVDHWIEHLFFRQWRASESDLRTFVMKAAHFIESGALVAAFGAALDRFSNGAGHAIYLSSPAGHFERAHGSLADAPALLEVDDDIAVSLRTSHQGVALTEAGAAHQAQLALPMLQGDKLKGIVLLGAKPEAQGYRPDELAVLEFAAARIGLDLNRLHAAQLTGRLRQIQRERELQLQEQRLLQQELDSVKHERETLLLALSKVGTSA